jgi:hypothetical protein
LAIGDAWPKPLPTPRYWYSFCSASILKVGARGEYVRGEYDPFILRPGGSLVAFMIDRGDYKNSPRFLKAQWPVRDLLCC